VIAMPIGELVKQTGLSKDTIRFYEKLGLIMASQKPAGTRFYKEYSQQTVERLLLIIQGKGLGFTLGEIKQLLEEWEDGAMTKSDLIGVIEHKIAEIEEKKRQLETISTYLVNKLSKLQQGLPTKSGDSNVMN
jgi:MerR family transcriptional regulator, copper efflux regulator